jgi:hypothetical protein
MTQEMGGVATAASEAGEPVTPFFPNLDEINLPHDHSELQYPYEDIWD